MVLNIIAVEKSMWITLLVCAVLLCPCLGATAGEQSECGLAVDAADRLAPDADKDCDYTKTGLNGVLHKAFAGKKEAASASLAATVPAPNNLSAALATANLIAKAEFTSAQQLQAVKFGLLEAAALKCPQGFVLESEQYVPAAPKTMTLALTYQCL
jgi:hypothetical protein